MTSLVKKTLTIILVFLFTSFGFSQAKPGDCSCPSPSSDPTSITVTLIVDIENFDPDNWQKSCSFKAEWLDSGKICESTPGKLEEFCICGHKDDTIIWEGKIIDKLNPDSDNGIVNIKKIKYKRGSRIFKKKGHGWIFSKKVDAKVVHGEKASLDYEYDLKFKIKRTEDANGKYTIDPKISIRPRGSFVKD